MRREDYMQLVNEYFDIHDDMTRKCLLSINEADQNQVMAHLASQLYGIIVKKTADIDFGQIPSSKGDLTKIPNYMDMIDSLEVIRKILVEKHQSTDSIDVIYKAIENMNNTRSIWEKGFALDCDFVMTYYNTMALSIVSSISIYISGAVEMVKNPDSGDIDIEINKMSKFNSKDNLLMKNLASFNKAIIKGDVEKVFNELLTAQRTVTENGMIPEPTFAEAVIGIVPVLVKCKALHTILGLVASGIVIARLVSCILPILHQTTTMLYNLRQSASDYFDGESEIIRLNAEKVNYDTSKTPEKREKIIRKQMKIADRFKRWADKLAVKTTKANKDSEADIQSDALERRKIDDVVDELPDSGTLF